MATSPQPPRPPAPPQPSGSHSHFVAIALLFLALIVLIAGIALWEGLHILSNAIHVQVEQGNGGQKEVSITTPLGSLEVNHDVDEASLGLPIYPGATRLTDHDTATVNFDFGDEAKVQIRVVKYETADSLEKVTAFYRDRLADQVTKFRQRDEHGKTVFEMKHDKQDKVVALKSSGGKTVIELVRIWGGPGEGN